MPAQRHVGRQGVLAWRAGRWRCLLLEDCDELVRAGAKDAAGQALAHGATLAELHAVRSMLGPIDGRAEPAQVGQYL